MIDKEYGGYRLSCDCCGTIGGSFDSYDDAVALARQEGWQTVRQGSGDWWCNYCPECREDV